MSSDESSGEKTPLIRAGSNASVNNGIFPIARVKANSNKNLYLSCAAMLLGSLCLGITLGMSSPMIPDMQDDESANAIPMTDSDYSWFGSLMTLGAMAGGILGGGFIGFFGRKLTAMLCGIPFVGGMLLMAYAVNVPMLLIGRTLTGFSGGVASLVVPTYISETSTPHLRGLLGSANQLSITFGILIAYALGIFLTWRWLAIASAVPCAMLTLFTAFVPETPRFLLMQEIEEQQAVPPQHQHRRQSRHSLVFLRGQSADIESELKALEDNLGKATETVSWLDLLRKKSIRTPLLLSLGVMFFQQGSGVNCVMFYSKNIFRNAGFTSETMQNVALILVAFIQVLFTFIACVIMDKAGRKALLIVSGSFMALSSGTFGLYFQLSLSGGNNSTGFDLGIVLEELDASSGNLNWLALASLLIYMAAFAIGLGPVPWLILSEIIPVRARGKASGLSTGFNWVLAFIFTKEFHDMQVAFTTQGTFWIFAGICLIGIFYHGILLPETKGKTLEEITAYFDPRPNIHTIEEEPEA
ncbi:solute carrier family 2, facilitated glucose transporter member 8-like [Styela clava]